MKIKISIFICFIAFTSVCFADSDEDGVDYLLDRKVLPKNYELLLTPYLLENEVIGKDRFTFDGSCIISVEAQEAGLTSITLHAKDLNIKTVKVVDSKNEDILEEQKEYKPDPVTDKLVLTLKSTLNLGEEYKVSFVYSGLMGDDMHGFYKSNYNDSNNKEVWIGSTQFQTHHARRAFPCFDEPGVKATFVISINRHNSFEATVGNTNIANSMEGVDGRILDMFKPTPPMSTYLVAFIVSNFKVRPNNDKTFLVIARPEAFEQTNYALEVGQKLLQKLDDYTGFKYKDMGLEKMHLAAIPDFSAGAMENWGLLTYRETALLYEPTVSTKLAQQRVASVIAHEQAHMWFGDLVTCDWWSYTWLNEGFARYFQYFTTHEVEPTWELDKQFVVEQIHSVFNMDSLEGTLPMTNENTRSPADLRQMFGSISYNKGASVIRMVTHVMGQDTFKSAIQKYLADYQFKASKPEYLIKGLAAEWTNTKVNLTKLLKRWTEQEGYPVVTIELSEDKKSIIVDQKRFFLNGCGGKDFKWIVPFTYTTNKNNDFKNTTPAIFLEGIQKIDLGVEVDWVIGNIQQTGYYRVNYDEATWHSIHKALNAEYHSQIHELNRAQIVDDLFNFGRSGLLNYTLVFPILEYLRNETNYLPWYAAFNGFNYLAIRLGSENEKQFKNMVKTLTDRVYKKLTFNALQSDTRLDIYNRASVLSWACKYGHETCVENSKEYFTKLMNSSTAIPVDIRSVVYCTGVREGDGTYFEHLWGMYLKENVATEQVLILSALGCTKNKEQIETYLGRILNVVRLQDRSAALSAVYTGNVENVDIVYDYITANYEKVAQSFGGMSDVASILSGISSRFTKIEQHSKFKKFIADNLDKLGDATGSLEKSLRTVEDNLKWSELNLHRFRTYLIEKHNSATSVSISVTLVTAFAIFVSYFNN